MDKIEIKLSKKTIKDGILVSCFLILLSVVICIFNPNSILTIFMACILLAISIFTLMNVKRNKNIIMYILNCEGLYINMGQENYVIIPWRDIAEDGHTLCKINNKLHVQLNIHNKEFYNKQLSKTNKLLSNKFYNVLGLKETTFPIEGYTVEPKEFLELIARYIDKYSSQ